MSRVGYLTMITLLGCIRAESFPCTADNECDLGGRTGRCELESVCSYPDDSCPSRRRYEAEADDGLAAQCVPLALTCPEYCTLFDENCSAAANPYSSPDVCRAECAQGPIGSLDDKQGDSLGCRINRIPPNGNCREAGPTGADVCSRDGTPECAPYCQQYDNFCAMVLGLPDFSPVACEVICQDWYPGSVGSELEDSLGCRFFHLQLAMMTNEPAEAAMNCVAAIPQGGGVCELPTVE